MATSTFTAAPTTTSHHSRECTTAVPGRHGHVSDFEACNAYYNFDPELAPAVAVAVIFGLFTLCHAVLAFIYNKRYAWVLIMGALWETLAFILHALGSLKQQNLGYAPGHAILYLLAPLWINAFVYMTVARMIYFFVPEQKIGGIKSTSLSKIFVAADIVTFLVQAVGGSMASPGAETGTIKTGLTVYMVGMGIQEACILAFVFLMILFHRRVVRLDTEGGRWNGAVEPAGSESMFVRGWGMSLFALYGVLGVITIRIVYRIAEFAKGVTPTNPIPFHEVYSYVLDAFPMMLALLLLAIWHPGRVLQGPGSDFKEVRSARREAKRAKKEEKIAVKKQKKAAKAEKRNGYVGVSIVESAVR
ncbi:RTA1 like protein-domain-containing protein [Coniochaeta sp. 2T2.1]|nr:RTA1 like protein-domain-containing protein [Coniochaeta sp. 2T2.1]